ncbi:MAG: DRTGG domain-containing protein [Bacteroidales bacterium]|jgi:predicted transcriptional regulator|nr:DRTGG domain-containing protein [Bacteroidales bacterium]
MKIKDIVSVIEGKVICGHDLLESEIHKGFASDLMSDVLTLDTDGLILITGLANTQTIRTAEMSDISCIVYARNKKISEDMINLAIESKIVLIECSSSVFKTSGLLYNAGIKPVF